MVEKGERIGTGFKTHKRLIVKDEAISFTEKEVEGVITTLELIITPEVVKASSAQSNQQV